MKKFIIIGLSLYFFSAGAMEIEKGQELSPDHRQRLKTIWGCYCLIIRKLALDLEGFKGSLRFLQELLDGDDDTDVLAQVPGATPMMVREDY